MNERFFYVYILAKARNSTFYVGVTSDLIKRMWEHKNNINCNFTTKHGVKTLVYYEVFQDAETAILREKRLKKYNRIWKMRLIEAMNPEWKDLADVFLSGSPPARG